MLIHGRKGVVSIWFVLWGKKETGFSMDIYKTAAGLKKWATSEVLKDLPVARLGKMEFSEAGYIEKIYWTTREDFLSQYEYLFPQKNTG